MTTKMSTTVLNAMLDAFETAVGASPILKLRTGAAPANCAASDTGTVIATINLGADFMSNAASAIKSFSSTPLEDASADNAGTVGHFRLYANNGTTCHDQGSVTTTGGGGDMELDNTVVTAGQKIDITSWQLDMSALV